MATTGKKNIADTSKGSATQPSQQPQSQTRGKKHVEWSPNLSSAVDPPAVEGRSPMWDSETNHMISYFLGGDQNSPAQATFPQSQHNYVAASSAIPSASEMPLVTTSLGGKENPDDEDGDPVPPPTPATQYYFTHSSSSKSKNTNSHSGLPPVYPSGSKNHEMFQTKSADPDGVSPICLIGPGTEELMLPPPTGSTPASQQDSSKSGQPIIQGQNESHLQWLQQINSMAQHAASACANMVHPPLASSGMPPAPMAMHPPAMAMMPPPYPTHQTYSTHPMFFPQATLTRLQMQVQQPPQEESEEKRARRLERNRESARKSRRRKKERLSHLEAKVAKLHAKLDIERRRQIRQMPSIPQEDRLSALNEPGSGDLETRNAWDEQLRNILKASGPNSPVRRAIVDFEYTTLKQTLCPRYQTFLLWLTLHPEKFFVAGKEHHGRRDGNPVIRMTSGKMSSKQVGDELTNGRKLDDGTVVPPADQTNNGSQAAQSTDMLRMWPLFCFELSISVDQEEKILLAHKRVQSRETLGQQRSQIAASVRMASNLNEAVLYQSHIAAARSEKTFLDILTPRQVLVFQKWLESNRGRVQDSVSRRKQQQGAAPPIEKTSLMEVCQKLEEVLKISKSLPSQDHPMGETGPLL